MSFMRKFIVYKLRGPGGCGKSELLYTNFPLNETSKNSRAHGAKTRSEQLRKFGQNSVNAKVSREKLGKIRFIAKKEGGNVG